MDKLLNSGQFAASTGNIYLNPGSVTTGVKLIVMHNTGASNQQVQIFVNGTATSTKILDVFLTPLETITWAIEYPIMLTSAQSLKGVAGTASTVNYFIYGREE
jgi:archaellum component FlaF (FlaF/FlaG flagellin family)